MWLLNAMLTQPQRGAQTLAHILTLLCTIFKVQNLLQTEVYLTANHRNAVVSCADVTVPLGKDGN